MNRGRRGFALVMTLWALTILAVAGTAVVLAGRESFDVARNRYAAARAHWRAEGCANAARAEIDQLLISAPSQAVRTRRWRGLDTLVGSMNGVLRCGVELHAAGSEVDINNAADEVVLRALARIAGVERAQELFDALLDWRDTDDLARPTGAEREWYLANRRHAPRNAPFASIAELGRVRGFEQLGGLDTTFSVESGRISLATARPAVLASVPGLTESAAARIVEYRDAGHSIDELVALTAIVSPTDADSLMTRYADLAHAVVLEPDAWIVTARAIDGAPAIRESVELRLVRKADRAIVVRRRVGS